MWMRSRRARQLERLARQAEALAGRGGDEGSPPIAGDPIARLATALEALAAQVGEGSAARATEDAEVAAILASMVEGVIAVDRQSRILTVNPALEAIFDIQRSAVFGHSILEAIRNRAFSDILDTVLQTGRSTTRELEMLTPVERVFQVQAAPLTGNGRTVGAVAVLHDVTALRRLEGLRREFVANVSHELKTPLTSIKGFVETLLDGAVDDPVNNRKFLQIIAGHTEQLTRLIDDLLALSQIESREAGLALAPVPLRPVLEETLLMLKPQLDHRQIVVELDLPTDLPPLKADRDRLKQAVLNLLDNAVKFNVEGGTITISASPGHEAVLIHVTDAGIGIPPEDLPRIFERFYRVDKARSRQLGGTGLGLSIVKHIAEAHGGAASVQSQLGRGSTFSLRWPIA